MKVGSSIMEAKYFDDAECIENFAAAGFDCMDFALRKIFSDAEEERKYYTSMKELARKKNVEISQTHAPFLVDALEEEFLSDEFYEKQVTAIRQTAILGVKYIVCHPYVPFSEEIIKKEYDYDTMMEHNKQVNLKFFERLKPHLKKYGVVMAIENLFSYDRQRKKMVKAACSTTEEWKYYIDTLGRDCFCACFDIGHANLVEGESHVEIIEKMADRIQVIHAHDNHGLLTCEYGDMDFHLPPFTGTCPWRNIMRALKKVGFDGTFSFECGGNSVKECSVDYGRYLVSVGRQLLRYAQE